MFLLEPIVQQGEHRLGWTVSCMVRGWSRRAVRAEMPTSYDAGQKHAVALEGPLDGGELTMH